MKRPGSLVVLALVAFLACKKPETDRSTAATTASYTYVKKSDAKQRWSIEVPASFQDKGADVWMGDGFTIAVVILPASSPTSDRPSAIRSAGPGAVVEEKTLPRGFSFTLDKSNRDRVFVQQIARDKEVVRLTVTGPAAKKVELETLAGHLSATLEVSETEAR